MLTDCGIGKLERGGELSAEGEVSVIVITVMIKKIQCTHMAEFNLLTVVSRNFCLLHPEVQKSLASSSLHCNTDSIEDSINPETAADSSPPLIKIEVRAGS